IRAERHGADGYLLGARGTRSRQDLDQSPAADARPLPHVGVSVAVPGDQYLTAFTEGHRLDALTAGAMDACYLLSRADVPQIDAAIAVTDGQPAVRAERHRVHARGTGIGELAHRRSSGGAPQVGGPVNVAGGKRLAVRTERDAKSAPASSVPDGRTTLLP